MKLTDSQLVVSDRSEMCKQHLGLPDMGTQRGWLVAPLIEGDLQRNTVRSSHSVVCKALPGKWLS